MRAREDRCDCIAHAVLETTVAIPGLVESHQWIHIFGRDRTPECASCEIADDFLRTRRLVGLGLQLIAAPCRACTRSARGLADENFLATRGVAHARDLQRSTNLQRMCGLDAL